MQFTEFKLDPRIIEGISYMGFKEATPIQEQAIPLILEGKDLIACAQTGTGKTAAFLLPTLHHISLQNHLKNKCFVIVPTRELAIQIQQELEAFSYFTDANSIAIYGGGDGIDWTRQKDALLNGVDVAVVTPGRILALIDDDKVDLSHVKYLILDEADRMLDIGFHDDLMKIIGYLPKERQSLLFSATMPPKIKDLAKDILTNPEEIRISISKPAEGVLQAAYLTYDGQKTPLIRELIANKPHYKSILIFSSTKKKVTEIVRSLKGSGYDVDGISSNLEQNEREQVLRDFKSRKTRVLVATDVLSRGIDIKDINLVINYDVPNDGEDYVHRIGRTARADTEGVALTLINPDDMYKFKKIEDLIEKEVMKAPLPPALGDGPKWDPNYRGDKRRGKGKPYKGGKKGGHKSSYKGKSNFNKNK